MSNSISIIMATYNRAHTLPRAINSVLAQTFQDWELIIIDDGSTDETDKILSDFSDPRIKVLRHSPNRGVAFARNRGLDIMTGEWFTLLDSDDEILSNALEVLLEVPRRIDHCINAVTCNCMDSISGKFTGIGLNQDQWLDFGKMVRECSGEHWGITKTALLGKARFNEALPWGESVLWYKISRNALRYYIHEGLRIYHVEGADRLSKKTKAKNLERKLLHYREIAKETEYLEILKNHRPLLYSELMFRIVIVDQIDGRVEVAKANKRKAMPFWNVKQKITTAIITLLPSVFLRKFLNFAIRFR